jgi:iturin family lipopeptide synthetase A
MEKLPTLNQRLDEYLKDNLSKITLIKNGSQIPFSKADLKHRILLARKVFLDAGIKKGDLVIFQISSSAKKAFVTNFFALISLGAVPAFLTASRNKDQVHRLINVAQNNPKSFIVADDETLQFIQFLWNDCDKNRFIVTHEEIEATTEINEKEITYATLEPTDPVLVLYSSGSTSDPKGVVMNNDGLLKMLKSLLVMLSSSPKDIWLMWLPLEHVFGILASVTIPMYSKCSVVHMDSADFIQDPKSWFNAVHMTRATKTAAPNFAYPMLLKSLDGSENWDLSCLDFILNGGEPLSRKIVEVFEKTTEKFKIKKNIITPVYGLTEALGAVCMNRKAEYPKLDLNLLQAGIDFDLTAVKRGDMDLISQGHALDGMEIGIFNEKHQQLPELTVGEIHIKSDFLFSGYLNQDSTNLFINGWFDTGDLGFLYKNMLYVVGRKKDMFFIHGKNVYLRDIEQIIEKRFPYRVAACGENNLQTGENAVYLFVETSDVNNVPIQQLKNYVFSEMGFALKAVVPVKQMMRTAVGKIAKQKTLEAYKEGKL